MKKYPENTVGQRVRKARKEKGYTQTELANILGKALRTIQKYEQDEIEISISMINQLAKVLDTTATYLLGYKIDTDKSKITCLSDIMAFLFEMEKVVGLKFDVDVKKPPRDDTWECSIKFNGKADEWNADMCLFLESWADTIEDFKSYNMSKRSYDQWKDKTLAYYSYGQVETTEPEELPADELQKKRNEFLEEYVRRLADKR